MRTVCLPSCIRPEQPVIKEHAQNGFRRLCNYRACSGGITTFTNCLSPSLFLPSCTANTTATKAGNCGWNWAREGESSTHCFARTILCGVAIGRKSLCPCCQTDASREFFVSASRSASMSRMLCRTSSTWGRGHPRWLKSSSCVHPYYHNYHHLCECGDSHIY